MTNTRTLTTSLLAAATSLVLIPLFFTYEAQAATCSFTRDLQMGVTGDDVKCLQQYLNETGFKIAETGAGSPGKETGEFKVLTEVALMKWQEAKGVTPATGTFGPKSRAQYQSEQSGGGAVLGASTSNTTGGLLNSTVLQALLGRFSELERRVAALEGKKPTVGNSTTVSTPKPATGSKADQAEAALNAAADALDAAKDEIAEADDDGERVDVAEELFEEVADMLAGAEDLFDDGEYDRVLTQTKRALPLIEEAIDAIGKRENSDDEDEDEDEDLEDRLDDLRDQLDSLRDDVESALDEDEDVGDAEDYLDEAEDALDDAEDALDDGDEDEAEDALDDAEDLIVDAEDEL